MEDRLLIRGARIVTPTGIIEGDVLADRGKIARIGSTLPEQTQGAEIVDAAGRLLLPGLVELHVQGTGGYDLISDDPDDVGRMGRKLASFGTTSYLATTVIDVAVEDQRCIRAILREADSPTPGAARMLGIHLEGPFISVEKQGMILGKYICPPDRDRYEWVKDLCGGQLRMMTIAPEHEGALPIIEDMAAGGEIVPTLGHTNATYEEAVAGIEAGLRHVCHTANAMRSVHHRDPGALGAALMCDALTLQIICDGVHLHPAMIAWMMRLKGADRCAIITDGVGATGLPPGTYTYDGKKYIVDRGACRHESGRLMGTATTQLRMVKLTEGFTGLPLHEVVRMASLTPAAIVGADDRLGSIEEGKEADLLICDEELNVEGVFIGGRRVEC